jgi:CheY-like chemotaxis protein
MDGASALIKADENDYDAFLIDIGLPGKMDGIQTTKELKKIKDNKDKPYIAITAFAMAGDKEYFLSEGLTHYISKPFEFQKLIELIEKVLIKIEKNHE